MLKKHHPLDRGIYHTMLKSIFLLTEGFTMTLLYMQFQKQTIIALLCVQTHYNVILCCCIFSAALLCHLLCCVYPTLLCLHLHCLCTFQRQNTLSFLEQLHCPNLQIYTAVCKHFLHSLLLHLLHFNSMNNKFITFTFTAVRKISFACAAVRNFLLLHFSHSHLCVLLLLAIMLLSITSCCCIFHIHCCPYP